MEIQFISGNHGILTLRQTPIHIHIDRWRAILFVIVVLFFCLFSLLGLWRHWGYLTSIYDLGCFDQVVWMASNGHSLINTSILSTPMNWLGFHFQPILFAFAVLYKITPTVNWFVFAQAGALALSAWPVFLIAERVTASGKAALMWSLAYLCNPFLLNAAAWDFHPVSIAVPFLALGLLAVERKQQVLLVVVSIILLACKEHMGLAVAGLGLLYGVRHRAWAMGFSLFLAGIAAFVLVVAVVMPSYALTDQHIMFGENVGQFGLGRYSWLGESPMEVIERIVFEPMFVIRKIVAMGGLQYLFLLLVPFLFLSLGGILWLLPATADLLVNLLPSIHFPRSVYSYHSITIIPVLMAAAVHGGQRLIRYTGLLTSEAIASYILLANLIFGYIYAPLPFPGSTNIWRPVNTVTTYDETETIIRDIIGSASVSVQANIGAHFTQRELLYRYPGKVGKVEFVVLMLKNPSGSSNLLEHHLQMNTAEYLDSIHGLLEDKRYGVVFWDDPWLILQRGNGSDEHSGKILVAIMQLREEWGSNHK